MIRNPARHGWSFVPLRSLSTVEPEPDGFGRESECRAVICLRASAHAPHDERRMINGRAPSSALRPENLASKSADADPIVA